jgi:hypothetical protein
MKKRLVVYRIKLKLDFVAIFLITTTENAIILRYKGASTYHSIQVATHGVAGERSPNSSPIP